MKGQCRLVMGRVHWSWGGSTGHGEGPLVMGRVPQASHGAERSLPGSGLSQGSVARYGRARVTMTTMTGMIARVTMTVG